MARINPYLNFNDNCREAMNFYKECVGGELTITTVGESPMAAQMPPAMKDSILHSSLKIGDNMLMGSDMRKKQLTDGDTVSLSLNCSSEDEQNKFYKNLSSGGTIDEHLGEMPVGARIGALTDKFGKHWILYFVNNSIG
jgi:PhnB protein